MKHMPCTTTNTKHQAEWTRIVTINDEEYREMVAHKLKIGAMQSKHVRKKIRMKHNV